MELKVWPPDCKEPQGLPLKGRRMELIPWPLSDVNQVSWPLCRVWNEEVNSINTVMRINNIIHKKYFHSA